MNRIRLDKVITGYVHEIGATPDKTVVLLDGDEGALVAAQARYRELADELQPFVGQQKWLRFIGTAEYEFSDKEAPNKVTAERDFIIDRFEVLDDRPISEVIEEFRSLSTRADLSFDLMELRLWPRLP